MAKQKTRDELVREIATLEAEVKSLGKYKEQDEDRRTLITKVLAKYTTVAQPAFDTYRSDLYNHRNAGDVVRTQEPLSWYEIVAEIGKLLTQRHQVRMQVDLEGIQSTLEMLVEDKRTREQRDRN